jgi:pilus assembly protein Flp/PilA
MVEIREVFQMFFPGTELNVRLSLLCFGAGNDGHSAAEYDQRLSDNTRFQKGGIGMDRFKSAYARCLTVLLSEKAQAIVEYALILLLIAIVVIAMLKGIGGKTNTMYSTVNSAFSS